MKSFLSVEVKPSFTAPCPRHRGTFISQGAPECGIFPTCPHCREGAVMSARRCPMAHPSLPPASHLLFSANTALHCMCQKLATFLETLPFHFLSPSKFQLSVLIPSNSIQYKHVSRGPNFRLSALNIIYSQLHLRPIIYILIIFH